MLGLAILSLAVTVWNITNIGRCCVALSHQRADEYWRHFTFHLCRYLLNAFQQWFCKISLAHFFVYILFVYKKPPGLSINATYDTCHRRRINTEEKATVFASAWGTELIQFLAALAILHQDDLKKRMNRIKATWRNEMLWKMDEQPVRTTPPNHQPYQSGYLPNLFKSSLLLNG